MNTSDLQGKVEHVCVWLGYTPENGFVEAGDFSDIGSHRLALAEAQRRMSVTGAFGLWTPSPQNIERNRFTPLVYIATASSKDAAQQLHKQVWNQGIVPFLIIATPESVWLCQGFHFSSKSWPKSQAVQVNWNASQSKVPIERPEVLEPYKAHRLRSATAWRDYSLHVEGRVDRRLLSNLDSLATLFAVGTADIRRLAPDIANALIGRMLYLNMLIDRGLVPRQWLSRYKLDIKNRSAYWSKKNASSLFKALDRLFNGSIFPITPRQWSKIHDEHIQYLKHVLRHEAHLSASAMQLSFFDFDYAVIKTETLSAVYEQFLSRKRSLSKRPSKGQEGAHYTPPFLADFVLDQIETIKPLDTNQTICDVAAGSGVFLVSAYRRLIEHHLARFGGRYIRLEELKRILCTNIFGVERDRDACHVTAFSLYLTLLDYVSPEEMQPFKEAHANQRLFPTLVGKTILARDFFDTSSLPPGFPAAFHVVAGNPPWQEISKMSSPRKMERWRDANKHLAPIGNNQAAELFLWKILRCHLLPDGTVGLLLPAKSFLNVGSQKFLNALGDSAVVRGIANLAHFRYRLFEGAKHPPAATFVQNTLPKRDYETWVYSPNLLSQPVPRHGSVWAIAVDRSVVEHHRASTLFTRPNGLLHAFIWRRVDREIFRHLDIQCRANRMTRLQSLCEHLDLTAWQGAGTDISGVAEKYLLTAKTNSKAYYRHVLFDKVSRQGSLFQFQQRQAPIVPLPEQVLSRARSRFKRAFAGDIVFIPRTYDDVVYVPDAIAYNSSCMAIGFAQTSTGMTARKRTFLKGLAAFLGSEFGRYLAAMSGRRYMIDRRQVEIADMMTYPVPLAGLEDDRIDKLALAGSKGEVDEIVYGLVGLSSQYVAAVREFLNFRIAMRDGGMPAVADEVPDKTSMECYRVTLAHQLGVLIGRSSAYHISSEITLDRALGVVHAQYIRETFNQENIRPSRAFVDQALEHYDDERSNSFTDATFLWRERNGAFVLLVKPLQKVHWTIESAFTDSELIADSILGAHSAHVLQ